MLLLHGTVDTPNIGSEDGKILAQLAQNKYANQPLPSESFLGKYWPLLTLAGLLLLSAAGPEYLHRKYGRR